MAGTEDVLVLQGQQAAQAALSDLMQGLVSSKGGPATITGIKASATAAVLDRLASGDHAARRD